MTQDDRLALVPALLNPARLWAPAEILAQPALVPREPGVYGWYFLQPPPGVPTAGCHRVGEAVLLYVGIASQLQRRLKQHLGSDASRSTLRRSLGALLGDELGIHLQKINGRHRFGAGEAALSAWIAANARVVWQDDFKPAQLQRSLIHALALPLNVQHNLHPFRKTLSTLRKKARAAAQQRRVAGSARRCAAPRRARCGRPRRWRR